MSKQSVLRRNEQNQVHMSQNLSLLEKRKSFLIKTNPSLESIFKQVDFDYSQLFIQLANVQTKQGELLSTQMRRQFMKNNYQYILIHFFQSLLKQDIQTLKFKEKYQTFVSFSEWVENQTKFIFPDQIKYLNQKKFLQEKQHLKYLQSIAVNLKDQGQKASKNPKRSSSKRKMTSKERKELKSMANPSKKNLNDMWFTETKSTNELISNYEDSTTNSTNFPIKQVLKKDQQELEKNSQLPIFEDQLNYQYILENGQIIKKKVGSLKFTNSEIQSIQKIQIQQKAQQGKKSTKRKNIIIQQSNQPMFEVFQDFQTQNQEVKSQEKKQYIEKKSQQLQYLQNYINLIQQSSQQKLKQINVQSQQQKQNNVIDLEFMPWKSQKQTGFQKIQSSQFQNVIQIDCRKKKSREEKNRLYQNQRKQIQFNNLRRRLAGALRFPQQRFYIFPELAPNIECQEDCNTCLQKQKKNKTKKCKDFRTDKK